MNEFLVALISGFLIILGGLGSFLPILPGVPLSYAGMFFYSWYTGYEKITPTVLVVFGVLTLMTFVVDMVAPALGARGYKASSYGVLGAMIGAFVGIFVLGPLGVIIGPFVGGFLGEIIKNKNYEQAVKVAYGSLVGLVVGSLFKIMIVTGMLVYFVYSLFL